VFRVIAVPALCALLATAAAAQVSVHDGDTFTVQPPSPRGAHAAAMKIRPTGFDAAERGEPCEAGRAMDRLATAALAEVLAGARVVRIETTGRMSWERHLAVVTVDGRELGAIMVGRGLARPWRRGLRGWCD
jgi:endonuclease YncB( thermonuclease family)